MNSHVKDLIISIGMILLGSGAVYVIQTTPKAGGSMTDALSFSTLPTIYGGCLVALSLILCGYSIINILKKNYPQEKNRASSNNLIAIRLVCTFILTLGYAFVLQAIPFAISTAGFLFFMLVLYGRGWGGKTIIAALVGAGLFHLLFIEIINIPLN